jgi:hypothetical protein
MEASSLSRERDYSFHFELVRGYLNIACSKHSLVEGCGPTNEATATTLLVLVIHNVDVTATAMKSRSLDADFDSCLMCPSAYTVSYAALYRMNTISRTFLIALHLPLDYANGTAR